MFNLISVDKINHIDQLKWNNRVLIIKNDKKIDFSGKIQFLNQEFDERDFIIVSVKQQNTFINNRKMSKHFSSSIFKKIKNINSNQTFILIGKDGQVKKTYPSEIEIKNIFIDVDRMPMRKYEMQTRKK